MASCAQSLDNFINKKQSENEQFQTSGIRKFDASGFSLADKDADAKSSVSNGGWSYFEFCYVGQVPSNI